jgi:hypothetical protein
MHVVRHAEQRLHGRDLLRQDAVDARREPPVDPWVKAAARQPAVLCYTMRSTVSRGIGSRR